MSDETNTETIAITGVGLSTALSNDWTEFCQRLYQGDNAIKPVQHFDTSRLQAKLGAGIDPLPEPETLAKEQFPFRSKVSRLALFCVENAISQSRIDLSAIASERRAVVAGTGFGSLYDLEPSYAHYYKKGAARLSPLTIPLNMNNAVAASISMAYAAKGVVQSISSACASGLSAVFAAQNLIADGSHDVVLAGGIDLCLCETIFTGWDKMRILSKGRAPVLAQRPFDKDRSGIVLGEGAAFFVFERLQHAKARKARILARVKSIYQNADARDLVKPDSESQQRCIHRTLDMAQLAPSRISQIHCHGTGTPLNDLCEYSALKAVFREHLESIPLNAIKAMTGHTMGASGPLSLAAALHSFQSCAVYPQPNFTSMENNLKPNISPQGRLQAATSHILINAFAFGGTNCSMIIEHPNFAQDTQ